MIALLRKDIRVFRPVLILLALIVAFECLFPLTLDLLAVDAGRDSAEAFGASAAMGEILTIVLAAAVGGCAFAIERRDRSMDFLAMLPVSRWKIIGSKLIVAGMIVVPLWAILSTIVLVLSNREKGPSEQMGDLFFFAFALPWSGVLLTFGVAWLCGLFIRSPSISVCIGFACVLALTLYSLDWMNDRAFVAELAWKFKATVAVAVGAVCCFEGAFIFARRAEP